MIIFIINIRAVMYGGGWRGGGCMWCLRPSSPLDSALTVTPLCSPVLALVTFFSSWPLHRWPCCWRGGDSDALYEHFRHFSPAVRRFIMWYGMHSVVGNSTVCSKLCKAVELSVSSHTDGITHNYTYCYHHQIPITDKDTTKLELEFRMTVKEYTRFWWGDYSKTGSGLGDVVIPI